MLALGDSIAAHDRQLPSDAWVVESCAARDLVPTARTGYPNRSARLAAVDRRQIPHATFWGKSIEHCAQEVHQRGLASFVRSVEDRHAFGHRVN